MVLTRSRRKRTAQLIFKLLTISKTCQWFWLVWTDVVFFVTMEILDHKFWLDEKLINKIKDE